MSERNDGRIVKSLERWFAREQRPLPWRESYVPYEVWVAEVMAQQTRMDVVIRHWHAFIQRFPTVCDLASADEESVLAAWSGLGYYRRARMLREGAAEIMERFGGEIPRDPEELESIRGIGPYTAGAIASIAYDRAVPIVDGNVLRVLARIALFDGPVGSRALERSCRDLARELVSLSGSPRSFNQALMELGATICTPVRPACEACPVRDDCAARLGDLQTEFPRPRAKGKTIDLVIPVFLVTDRAGRFLLVRRLRGSLLEGMFVLPGEDPEVGAAVHVDGMRRRGKIGQVRHTITHRRIRFDVWNATIDGIAESKDHDVRWVGREELDSIPHPSWVRKAIELGGSTSER